jgi:hypothetical protein
MLKVVEPLPTPKVVPIAVNNAEYVERETAEPSHNNQSVGAVAAPYIVIVPEGIEAPPPPPDALIVTAPVAPDNVMLLPATSEVTPVFVTDTAPVALVFVLSPDEVVSEVTPALLIVTAPVAPETEIPVPATFEVTPVLVTLTAPVALVFVLNPEEEVNAVTPVFVTVIAPVDAETLTPVPAATEDTYAEDHSRPEVVEEFARSKSPVEPTGRRTNAEAERVNKSPFVLSAVLPSVAFTVTAPVAPDTDTFTPATTEVTPEFVMVTAPVPPDKEIPVPATVEVTPVFVITIAPVVGDTLIPVPPEAEATPAAPPVVNSTTAEFTYAYTLPKSERTHKSPSCGVEGLPDTYGAVKRFADSIRRRRESMSANILDRSGD